MPNTLTLFEHEARNFDWTDKDLSVMERVRRAAGAEVLRLGVRGGKRVIQAAQHVGVVRLGHRTVQVLPKIHRSGEAVSEAERAREATHNLLYLLAYAGQLPVREHALAHLLRHGDDWFEILTRLFASHLLEEWQRGAYRTYQTIEEEAPVLKGKWRIADQLRRPMRRHIFSVSYDEFTADNPLNRIFRFVVERLWRLTRNSENRQTLGELRQWMEEITLLRRVTVTEASQSMLTRLNQRYGPLLNLARLFLDGGALQLAAGDLSTFAFTFDMNQLFEAFIVHFIQRHRGEILPPELQACELLPQSHGATKYLARREAKPVFLLKPDLTFRDQARQFPLLLDAKYKRLDKADAKLGVSQADFYQMHAYAHRYRCRRVLLLYPQTVEMREPLRARFTLGNGEEIKAATVDLRVDLSNRVGKEQLLEEMKEVLAGTIIPQEGANIYAHA
jgi:5-methylcytosine-specific restriction enzyme subunit McrC